MNPLKNILSIIGAILLAVGITYLITSYQHNDRIEYIRESHQQQIDSLSVVRQNLVQSRDQIADSLRSLDNEFAEYILRTEQAIQNYTTILGTIRLERDSLKEELSRPAPTPIAELIRIDGSLRDTSITVTESWSDSLFQTEAIAQIHRDSLFLSSDLIQLRPLRIDVVTTVSDDQRQVNTFVRSEDFEELHIEAVTEITPKKRKPYGWYITAGLVLREIINLIR